MTATATLPVGLEAAWAAATAGLPAGEGAGGPVERRLLGGPTVEHVVVVEATSPTAGRAEAGLRLRCSGSGVVERELRVVARGDLASDVRLTAVLRPAPAVAAATVGRLVARAVRRDLERELMALRNRLGAAG